MMVISVAWLPVLIIPLVVHLSPSANEAITSIDYAIWGLFVVEYLIRLYLVPRDGTLLPITLSTWWLSPSPRSDPFGCFGCFGC